MRSCFVTGASGLVGGALCDSLAGDGVEVVAVSRSAREGGGARFLRGDPTEAGAWQDELAACDAVVHLAGESVAAGRWTAAQKRSLVHSRIASTERVVEAIRTAATPPSVLVCASAIGYYGHRGEEVLVEESPPADDFLSRLCVDWEAAAAVASEVTRVVCLRIGVVFARRGGALGKMLPPFRLGVGGPIGPPDRWFPWVHLDDVVGLVRFALERSDLAGAVNAVAPGEVRMGGLAKALGRALSRPAFFPPVPIAVLRLVLGEFADHVSPGARVHPERAQRAGYAFRHPDLDGALRACVG